MFGKRGLGKKKRGGKPLDVVAGAVAGDALAPAHFFDRRAGHPDDFGDHGVGELAQERTDLHLPALDVAEGVLDDPTDPFADLGECHPERAEVQERALVDTWESLRDLFGFLRLLSFQRVKRLAGAVVGDLDARHLSLTPGDEDRLESSLTAGTLRGGVRGAVREALENLSGRQVAATVGAVAALVVGLSVQSLGEFHPCQDQPMASFQALGECEPKLVALGESVSEGNSKHEGFPPVEIISITETPMI